MGWTKRIAVGPRKEELSLLSHRIICLVLSISGRTEVQAKYRNDMQVADRIVISAPLAEREGFEPSVRGYRTQHFQCCLFNHSSTAPGVSCLFCFPIRDRVTVQ